MDGQRILILSASFGNGHKQASKAIAEALLDQQPHAVVQVYDFMEDAHPLINDVMCSIYDLSCKYTPWAYGWVYYATARYNEKAITRHLLGYYGIRKMEDYIAHWQPDIIISTFPTSSAVLASLKRKGKLHVPFMTVITDYALHSQWIFPENDGYFVASEQLRQQLSSYNIPIESITASGIPVRPVFFQRQPKPIIKKELLATPHKKMILVMSNGLGGAYNMSRYVEKLLDLDSALHIVLACGRDERLSERLAKKFDHIPEVTVLGFTENIHLWMQAADLLVSKPGGLTTSEALQIGVPMILFRPVPGQELENAKYFQSRGYATWAEDLQNLVRLTWSAIQSTSFSQVQTADMKNPASIIAQTVLRKLDKGSSSQMKDQQGMIFS